MPRSAPSISALRPCVVCGAGDRSLELPVGDYEIHRCACGLRTLWPEPEAAALVEVFDDGEIYGGAFELRNELVAQSHRSLHALEKFVAPGRLLDVGFGPGFLLEAARARGWDAEGVDPSPYGVARALEAGFTAHQGFLQDLSLPGSSYDAITMMQVVEHLLDPWPLLTECRRLLRPGGALVVATPNPASLLARAKRERFNYWIPPIHCVWYTPSALERMLDAVALTPVRVWTWSAATRALHDGADIVASSRLGRRLPRRTHRPIGGLVGACADAVGRGSIVEAIALRWEDA